MTEPQETSAGEMRPEDVPLELTTAGHDALMRWHMEHPGLGINLDDQAQMREVIAAAMTRLGLREQWGTRWEGHERVQNYGCGPDAEATARETTHPRDTVVRRYVTDWEDADA